jgi:hypothetical protein
MIRVALLCQVAAVTAEPRDGLSLLQTSALTKKSAMDSTNAECKKAKKEEKEARQRAKVDRAAVKAARAAMKESRAAMTESRSLLEAASTARYEACVEESDVTGAAAYPTMIEDTTGKYCPIIYDDEPGHLWDLAPSCDDGIFMEGVIQNGNTYGLPSVPPGLDGFQECINRAKNEPACKDAVSVVVTTCVGGGGGLANGGQPRGCGCRIPSNLEEFQAAVERLAPQQLKDDVKNLDPPPHQIFANQAQHWASCTIGSKSKWRKMTKAALNVAPTVRLVATDCNEGYSRQHIQPLFRPDALLASLSSTSWEECLAKVKAEPKCSQAMAVEWHESGTYGNAAGLARCDCYSWYSGPQMDWNSRSCVLMDKFVGDSPAFANFHKEVFKKGLWNNHMTKREREVSFR